jgi:hypothetical protein
VFSDSPEVWSVAPDGSHLHKLTRFPDFAASYSPDGHKILAADLNLPGCGCLGLVLVNPKGHIEARVLTSKQFPGLGVEVEWGVAP